MTVFEVQLFREFAITRNGEQVRGLEAQKVRELFCFLLINRERPHTRERLASLLWPKSTISQARQYLRQTLCHLHSALNDQVAGSDSLMSVEQDWVGINMSDRLWVDVVEFETIYGETRVLAGRALNSDQAGRIKRAIQLYRGDLLEDCYVDWCVFERERLQNLYLALIDKLVGYSEATNDTGEGIAYASELLRMDVAHERTYRRLMRLLCRTGDRTGAIRQYERCRDVLRKELGVEPSRRTQALFHQIQNDQLATPFPLEAYDPIMNQESLDQMLTGLATLNQRLIQTQHQLEKEIDAIKAALSDLT